MAHSVCVYRYFFIDVHYNDDRDQTARHVREGRYPTYKNNSWRQTFSFATGYIIYISFLAWCIWYAAMGTNSYRNRLGSFLFLKGVRSCYKFSL